tara:strand:+ start:253 stop:528 length:276 start_codon:yes stop_codon:yes gene_type:complete
MKLYKVSSNYHRGIKDFESIKDNGNGTFDSLFKNGSFERIRTKSFLPDYKNGSAFFKTYEEAKEYITLKIKESIKHHEHIIKKGNDTLNAL